MSQVTLLSMDIAKAPEKSGAESIFSTELNQRGEKFSQHLERQVNANNSGKKMHADRAEVNNQREKTAATDHPTEQSQADKSDSAKAVNKQTDNETANQAERHTQSKDDKSSNNATNDNVDAAEKQAAKSEQDNNHNATEQDKDSLNQQAQNQTDNNEAEHNQSEVNVNQTTHKDVDAEASALLAMLTESGKLLQKDTANKTGTIAQDTAEQLAQFIDENVSSTVKNGSEKELAALGENDKNPVESLDKSSNKAENAVENKVTKQLQNNVVDENAQLNTHLSKVAEGVLLTTKSTSETKTAVANEVNNGINLEQAKTNKLAEQMQLSADVLQNQAGDKKVQLAQGDKAANDVTNQVNKTTQAEQVILDNILKNDGKNNLNNHDGAESIKLNNLDAVAQLAASEAEKNAEKTYRAEQIALMHVSAKLAAGDNKEVSRKDAAKVTSNNITDNVNHNHVNNAANISPQAIEQLVSADEDISDETLKTLVVSQFIHAQLNKNQGETRSFNPLGVTKTEASTTSSSDAFVGENLDKIAQAAEIKATATGADVSKNDFRASALASFVNTTSEPTTTTGLNQAHEVMTHLETASQKHVADNVTQVKATQVQLAEAINIHHKDFADNLKNKVMVMISQKLQQADITLDPPELGNVQVRVNLQGDAASVSFVVQNPQAKDALEQQMQKLRDMLSQAGVDVGEANVRQEQKGNAQNGEGNHHGNGSSGLMSQEGNEVGDDSQILTQLFKPSPGGVDFFA